MHYDNIPDQDAYGKQQDCVDTNVIIQIVQDKMIKENILQTKEQMVNA